MICEEKCFTVSIAYDRRDYCFCTACGSGANSSDKEVPKNPSGDTSAEDADTESMTTAELVDAILRDPEMTVFSAYNDSMQALEMFRQTYNVYGELNNRDDVLGCAGSIGGCL